MYECVVFARYLSLHPEKTGDYMATFHAQWAKVLENVSDPATTMPEVHKVISAKVPAYAAGKYVDLDWSDKNTLKMQRRLEFPIRSMLGRSTTRLDSCTRAASSSFGTCRTGRVMS